MKYIFIKINLFLIINILIYLFTFVLSFEKPGRKNPKYKINDYFGSRYLSTYLASTFLNDTPTIVFWSNGRFIHHKSPTNMYISNYHRNTIDYIENENLQVLAGKFNASFRNGDSENARFNCPLALVLYNETSFPNNKEVKYFPVLFSEDKANQPECVYATISNYSVCKNQSYTLEQLSETGDPYDINPYLVKLLKKDNEINSGESLEDDEFIFLFVTDTNNHCIRKIDLVNIEVTTFAGECTEKGFKDGPLGINRFNEPQGIGIDSYGNLYVYDAGNRYIRLISPDGYVKTLIQGACFGYKLGEDIENNYNYKSQYLLCFRKWIKTSGQPLEHIYYSNEEEYCYENIVNCPNYLSNQKRKNKK